MEESQLRSSVYGISSPPLQQYVSYNRRLINSDFSGQGAEHAERREQKGLEGTDETSLWESLVHWVVELGAIYNTSVHQDRLDFRTMICPTSRPGAPIVLFPGNWSSLLSKSVAWLLDAWGLTSEGKHLETSGECTSAFRNGNTGGHVGKFPFMRKPLCKSYSPATVRLFSCTVSAAALSCSASWHYLPKDKLIAWLVHLGHCVLSFGVRLKGAVCPVVSNPPLRLTHFH